MTFNSKMMVLTKKFTNPLFQGFLNLIKEWQPNLYDTSAVINAVHEIYDKKYKHILLEALAILYSHEKEYEKAIAMYLKLQHKDVFTLIKKHDLYNAIHHMIVDLIKLDSEKAIAMLLEKNKIAPEIVVKQLENHQEYLYMVSLIWYTFWWIKILQIFNIFHF